MSRTATGAGQEMTLLGHITELRRRMIRCVIALVITTLISLILAKYIFDFLIAQFLLGD